MGTQRAFLGILDGSEYWDQPVSLGEGSGHHSQPMFDGLFRAEPGTTPVGGAPKVGSLGDQRSMGKICVESVVEEAEEEEECPEGLVQGQPQIDEGRQL